MPGLLHAAKSIRIIGALVAVIGMAGAIFGIGTFAAFVEKSTDPLHVLIQDIPATMIDIFLFGVAAGGGITAYILLGYIKDEK